MKPLHYLLLFLLTPSFFFAQSYTVNGSKSNIEWLGKKTTGAHNGTILVQEGFMKINNNGDITDGEFILNMQSITCSDLKGSKKEYLEEHLKAEDFFNTKEYSTASFKITKVNAKKIFGVLTIKGIAKDISFDYKQTEKLKYEAEIIVDRTLFDIKYKSKTIFKDIGDHFIYDDFIITLNPIIFK